MSETFQQEENYQGGREMDASSTDSTEAWRRDSGRVEQGIVENRARRNSNRNSVARAVSTFEEKKEPARGEEIRKNEEELISDHLSASMPGREGTDNGTFAKSPPASLSATAAASSLHQTDDNSSQQTNFYDERVARKKRMLVEQERRKSAAGNLGVIDTCSSDTRESFSAASGGELAADLVSKNEVSTGYGAASAPGDELAAALATSGANTPVTPKTSSKGVCEHDSSGTMDPTAPTSTLIKDHDGSQGEMLVTASSSQKMGGIEGNSEPSIEESEETAPGAYAVHGRAFGQFPEWGRFNRQQTVTTPESQHLTDGSETDEEPVQVSAVVLDEELQQKLRQEILEKTARAEVVEPVVYRKFKRKHYIACLVLVLVVIAVAVGLSVGLSNSGDAIFVDKTPAPTWASSSPSLSPTDVIKPTLETVLERGKLRCGGFNVTPYFYMVNETGVGFEFDLCRAVAAAVFGDGTRAEPVRMTGISRFEFLSNRSVDLLTSLTTHTIERDVYQAFAKTGFSYTIPYLYNGLIFAGTPPFGACANNLSSYHGECSGLQVCVGASSSHFPVVKDLLPSKTLVTTTGRVRDAFIEGKCNAMAGEITFLAEKQLRDLGYEGVYEVGTNVFAKEPLAAVTRDDDPEWSDFVNWVLQALLAAEEQGITQDTADTFSTVSVFGKQFENMFINAISAVGNFGEIYNRHLEDIIPRQVTDNINRNGSTGLLYSHSFGLVDRIGPGPVQGGTLEKIESRGHLRCGITVRTGFGEWDAINRQWSGLDADYCGAVSASVFNGTSVNIEFVELPVTQERYSALANGEVDVLSGGRVNIVTDVQELLSRQGFSFSQPYFYSPARGVSWNSASREVLALATRQDDSQWSDFVYWVVASTFYAEENFIAQRESDEMPLVNLFGLSFQTMFRDAVSAVGHYGELYERNLGKFGNRTGRNLPNVIPFGPQHSPLPGI